ncbi:hypothetical protein [Actinoplanes sp. CA-252034]|uniref:hypothetical protein n=1 Tax=Actinoplanes sp. CA-252034 TaxID=3239906 RepID=UPI003D97A43F
MMEIGEPGGEQDVRWVMAALRAAGEPRLDDVPWARFTDECWAPDSVPGLLRALSDPGHAAGSLGELWAMVRNEGISDVTGALAVPFLLRIAADPAASQRGDLLRLAAEVGHREHFGTDVRASFLQVVDEQDCVTVDGYGRPVAWTCQAAREAVTLDVCPGGRVEATARGDGCAAGAPRGRDVPGRTDQSGAGSRAGGGGAPVLGRGGVDGCAVGRPGQPA